METECTEQPEDAKSIEIVNDPAEPRWGEQPFEDNKEITTQESYNNFAFKTGTNVPIMLRPHEFIDAMEPYEETAEVKETIVEECLRKDNDRIIHPENLMNRIIYDSLDPSPHTHKPRNPGQLPNFYVPSSDDDCTLVFESRFESGNLRRAVQVYEFEYDLILNMDFNTRSNTQWYFFSVENTRAGKTYRINIINMIKPDSLYNFGMKPLMYSVTDAKKSGKGGKGWVRCGTDICYYQNNMKRKNGGNYYSLTFSVVFGYDYDTVYFAHCYPYTYTDLCTYLRTLTADPKKKQKIKTSVLCQTAAGNDLEVVTITNFSTESEPPKQKKYIVLLSRVHPGESQASWIMKGVIDYLLSPTLDAKILRENFVFKLVPMVNPDGVINGAYRCGLAGVDLNRTWMDPSKKQHPTIYNIKAMIKKLTETGDVVLAVDFHGHSRKKNNFMYGCPGRTRLKERVFPKVLEKVSEIFSFKDCVFGLQKSKEGTARIVMFKEMGIVNSYTLESSFCGSDFGKHADFHFSTEHYQEIGHNLCDAILEFFDTDQSKIKSYLEELEMLYPRAEEESDEDAADSDYSGDENFRKKKKKKMMSKKKNSEKRKK
jgi:hypothetical protein